MNPVERALRAVDGLQQRHSALGLPFGVVKKFGDDQAGSHAALIAYYGFFSLFPLLLVGVTVLGFALRDNPAFEQRVLDSVLAQLPIIGGDIQVRALTGGGLSLALGIAGTLWGGLGVTQHAQNAMNAVWNVPRKQRPNFWLRLARGLGLLVLLGGGAIASTVLAGLATAEGASAVGRALPLAASLLVNLALFLLAFQVLTAIGLPWRRLVPGTVVAAVGWVVLQSVGGYYVNRQLADASQVYGTFGLVIGLLSWLYLTAQLVLYAAELNVVLARRLWPRSLLQPPLTEADRRVLADLAMVEERRPEQSIAVTFEPEAAD
ncbi:MAG: YihY/virulence factor BrkB family protein [Euzebyaceae bacterium]|nr:YihY/virulence factor BrkB family protein [Euzebyaceae bacterium]